MNISAKAQAVKDKDAVQWMVQQTGRYTFVLTCGGELSVCVVAQTGQHREAVKGYMERRRDQLNAWQTDRRHTALTPMQYVALARELNGSVIATHLLIHKQ